MPPPVATPFLIIAGATATGKSDFAAEVALAGDGEIVGADAFQIYAGLPILTAQPDAAARARVPHHLVGEVAPSQRFDVAHYLERARACLAEVHARGRVPIVCGGTGLYLRALVRGLAELPAADATLRAELEARPLTELTRQLTELDPAAATRLDLANPRRVIRALEVCLLTGRPFSSFREEWAQPPNARGFFIQRDRAELHARIAARVDAMFAAGVEAEVRTAASTIGETAASAIGFREIQRLLAGEITREQCAELIVIATRQYAKRQETWFRREPGLQVLDLTHEPRAAAVARAVAELQALRATP